MLNLRVGTSKRICVCGFFFISTKELISGCRDQLDSLLVSRMVSWLVRAVYTAREIKKQSRAASPRCPLLAAPSVTILSPHLPPAMWQPKSTQPRMCSHCSFWSQLPVESHPVGKTAGGFLRTIQWGCEELAGHLQNTRTPVKANHREQNQRIGASTRSLLLEWKRGTSNNSRCLSPVRRLPSNHKTVFVETKQPARCVTDSINSQFSRVCNRRRSVIKFKSFSAIFFQTEEEI